MENRTTLATVVTDSFMSLLPAEDVTMLQNGEMILYSPKEATTYLPLVISKKDDMIVVTPEDDIPEDALVQLFSEDAFDLDGVYEFSEETLTKVLGTEPEQLCSIIGFIDTYKSFDFFDTTEFIKMLQELTSHEYGICTVMLALDTLDKKEFMQLCVTHKETPDALWRKFNRFLVAVTEKDYN